MAILIRVAVFMATKKHVNQYTIGNSRITFHQFIFRELFLVIISSWFTSNYSGRIISRNLSDFHVLPHFFLQATYVIITSENSGGINYHPAAKGVRQKESGKKVTKKVTKASEKVTEK